MKRTPTARWHAALVPIVAHVKAHPEAKRELLATLRRNGCPWARQQLDAYLCPVQSKRQEPRLGAGLALLEAAAEVMQSKQPKGQCKVCGFAFAYMGDGIWICNCDK